MSVPALQSSRLRHRGGGTVHVAKPVVTVQRVTRYNLHPACSAPLAISLLNVKRLQEANSHLPAASCLCGTHWAMHCGAPLPPALTEEDTGEALRPHISGLSLGPLPG